MKHTSSSSGQSASAVQTQPEMKTVLRHPSGHDGAPQPKQTHVPCTSVPWKTHSPASGQSARITHPLPRHSPATQA